MTDESQLDGNNNAIAKESDDEANNNNIPSSPKMNELREPVAEDDDTATDDVENAASADFAVAATDNAIADEAFAEHHAPSSNNFFDAQPQQPQPPVVVTNTRNYYPTFPVNVSTMARRDSEVFPGTSEDDDDDDNRSVILDTSEDEGVDDGCITTEEEGGNSSALDNSSGLDVSSVDDLPLRHTLHTLHSAAPMNNENDEDTSPLFRENSHAASAPSLLAGLPETYRPFGNRSSTPTYGTYGGNIVGGNFGGSGYSSNNGSNFSNNFGASTTNHRTSKKLNLPNIPLHTLPIDALHATSTYCTPSDWASLTSTSKAWRSIGREVLDKVWRHAGRCMVEVGVAWARGEHSDARELASLYISKGVPIYPTPHGHSYHTIAWRMGLELERMAEETDNENDEAGGEGGTGGSNTTTNNGDGENDDETNNTTDPFYTERYVENSPSNNNHRNFWSRSHLTYVEEKSIFWKQKKGIELSPPPSSFPPPTPPPPTRGGEGGPGGGVGGGLFPRRFSFSSNTARGPQDPVGMRGNGNPTMAAGLGDMGGASVLTGSILTGSVTTSTTGGMGGAEGGAFGAAQRGGATGLGLARPPPMPMASNMGGVASTQPICGGSSSSRPTSAFSEQFAGSATSAAASASSAAATATASSSTARTPTGPRYVRRASFSGTNESPPGLPFVSSYALRRASFSGSDGAPSFVASPLLASRNGSAPNLFSGRSNTNNLGSPFGGTVRGNADWGGGGAPPTPPVVPPAPKMTLRIHRHLADQHLFGSPSVNDENGSMFSGKLSMSADFFHPTWDGGRRGLTTNNMNVSNIDNWDGYHNGMEWTSGVADSVPGNRMGPEAVAALPDGRRLGAGTDIGETIDRPQFLNNPEVEQPPQDRNPLMENSNYRAAVRAFVNWTLANANERRNSLPSNPTARGTGRLHALLNNPSAWSSLSRETNSTSTSPAADVHLEVYSSTSANLKSDNEKEKAASEAVSKVHARAKFYQSKLDSLLKQSATNDNKFDTTIFQECLLDYWDELFPTTAGIHFYNQQSPVPRMTRLHSFLTTPCPKAIGTVQCEIERVKISSKSKGAKGMTKGMKGKFFPSYEYRLFIRDTKNDNPFHTSSSGNTPTRKDSVLLVAKNKSGSGSKKDKNINGVNGGASHRSGGGSGVGGLDFASAATPSNRRGVTNYYMCLPSQKDVDGHYKNANRNNPNAVLSPGQTSGLAMAPAAAQSKNSVEVGRLQSNFIGTEFQIFIPNKNARNVEDQPRGGANDVATSEEGDAVLEGDSRVYPIDTAVPTVTNTAANRRPNRRGSGLVRMARRASQKMTRRGSSSYNSESNGAGGEPTEDSNGDNSLRRSKKAIRRMSWGSPSNANSRHRTSRRAIANNSDLVDGDTNNMYSAALAMQNATSVTGMGEVENGAITYTANLLGNRPRIMDVCIPKLTEDGQVCAEWSGESEAVTSVNSVVGGGTATMLDHFKTIQQGLENLEDDVNPNNNNNENADNGGSTTASNAADTHGLMILQNRPPWWNIELGAFVLNFGGRVKVASVKNFQLCERNDQDHIMQFGRIEGRHAFTMDFQHPLTPMQAFAIAISSLQSKISFG